MDSPTDFFAPPPPLPDDLYERYERRLSDLFRRHFWHVRPTRKGRKAARRFFRSIARELTPAHRPFLDGYPRTPRGADRMLSWLATHDHFWRLGLRAEWDPVLQVGEWQSTIEGDIAQVARFYTPNGQRWPRHGAVFVTHDPVSDRWEVEGTRLLARFVPWTLVPTAAAGMRLADEALLRAGLRLHGDVHASPLTHGLRARAQGEAR